MTAPEPVLQATAWPTNGHMIADLHRLGYITDDDIVLDPTYQNGVWWSVWRPPNLIAHDLYHLDGVDWAALPEADESVDVVAWDPPYVCPGGRESSTVPEFHERFGMDKTPLTPESLTAYIATGFPEMRRVLKRRRRGQRPGRLLLKCANYVWGGTYRREAYNLLALAEAHGFTLYDEAVFLGKPQMQPTACQSCKNDDFRLTRGKPPCKACGGTRVRRQVHLRSNYSLCFVFENGKPDPPAALPLTP